MAAPANNNDSPSRFSSRWLREPLLHFVLLGGALFALDHYVVSRADDPNTIVVGPTVDKEARDVFAAARGREPDADELVALRQVWLDNEVLYREGVALQVDRGDPGVRERVIFKALTVIEAGLKVPPADEQALRDWFESHRDQYDEPARYDFQEAVISSDASEGSIREFAHRLNSSAPGDADAGLRVFTGRPRSNLDESYGPGFANALEEAPIEHWAAIHTSQGWRAIRVEKIAPSTPAVFEAYAGVVLQDWRDAAATELRTAAVRALAKKYTVKYEASAGG